MSKITWSNLRETAAELLEKNILSKLRVFYQIVLIIAVMIVFLIIQWSISKEINNKMRKDNFEMYQMCTQRYNYIVTIKSYVQQIQAEYLKVLSQRSSDDLSTKFNIKGELLPATRALKDIDPMDADRISAKVVAILDIIGQPVDDEHYNRLEGEINQIKPMIDVVHSKIMDLNFNAMKSSSQYSLAAGVTSFFIMIIGTLISLFIGLTVATAVSKPLKDMELAAKSLARGDLSKHVNASSTACPEINEAVKGLNLAISGLRELVEKINHQSDTLLSSSRELRGATLETGKSSEEVAKAMEELAKSSSEQTNQVNQAVESVNYLSELVTKVSYDSEYMAVISQQVAESAAIGQKTSADVTNEINELYNSISQVAKVINEFTETSVEINEITAVIHNVAEQTTLLALNASIEAARAGEHGKGFGVVARETGALAIQSEQAADRISELIDKMNERITNAVGVMQQSTKKAETGKTLALEATVTFEYIFKALETSLHQIDAVTKSAKRMAESNAHVIDSITTIAAISEENMASTQEVLASAEEQTASAQQVITLAEHLNRISDDLRRSVSSFELEQEKVG